MVGSFGTIGTYYNQNAILPASQTISTKDSSGKISPTFDDSQTTKAGRTSSPADCQTCKERKYQDGSDEMVSFKSASHISPEASMGRVMAHEQEHVANAYSKAAKKDGEVVSANVSLKSAICPECGRSYISGGETRTQIKYTNDSNPYQQDKKTLDSLSLTGMNIDIAC